MMMPHWCVSFLATVLWSLGIWLMLLSSIKQFSSTRSGSAAVSLISVSRSSIKSNSAALILSSSCLFLVAFFDHPIYWDIVDRYVFDGTVAVVLDGYGGVTSGSCIVTSSSGFDDLVDSVFLFLLFLSVCSGVCGLCGMWSPKFLKYLPPIRDCSCFSSAVCQFFLSPFVSLLLVFLARVSLCPGLCFIAISLLRVSPAQCVFLLVP